MESRNNNRYDQKRKGRITRKRRWIDYWAACATLCFLLAVTVFGAASLQRPDEKTTFAAKESMESTEDFAGQDGRQSETVSAKLDRANTISVDITAKSAIVLNTGTNTALYQKNGTEKIAPASTAKMIVALTALDYLSPDDEVTVGAEIKMIHDDSSRAWLTEGDTLTVRQLLIALMLPSGNDAAYTFAVHTGKIIAGDNSLSNKQSIEVFMEQVNEKARALGAENSNFVVPDGYDAEGQYTTAYDLAVIAKACLDNSTISDVVASNTSYEKWLNGREVTYKNTNELINPKSQYYRPEVIGLKTGTSSLGGACVVSAAVIDGETYICVVMGSTKDSRFPDCIKLLDKIKTR